MIRIFSMIGLVVFVLLLLVSQVNADTFTGQYHAYEDGESLVLSINKQTTHRYIGRLFMEGDELPFSAQIHGQKLIGSIDEEGESYGFIANKQGQRLVLKFEDGMVIMFNKSQSGNKPVQTVQYNPQDYYSYDRKSNQTQSKTVERKVYINGKQLSSSKLNQLESAYQTRIENGRYWYDKQCGAWGMEGGPTVGFIMAGLDLPGPMQANSSGGGTGIFINGREIHPLDQQGLQQLFGITYQGRYWLDAQGNLGVENGPFIVNIVSAIQQAQSQQSGGSVTHGYGKGYGSRGTLGGGMYSGRTASGKSVFWYPGM